MTWRLVLLRMYICVESVVSTLQGSKAKATDDGRVLLIKITSR